MYFPLCYILFGVIEFFPKTETQAAQFLGTPSNPSYAVEGQDLSLVWTYILDGNLNAVRFSKVTESGADPIGVRFGPGIISSTQKYEARFRAQATSTRAELMILAVQLSDEATYQLNLVSSKLTSITHNVKVIVQFKPEISVFTVGSSNESICKGDIINVTCSAAWNPVVHTYQLFRDAILVQTSDESTLFWKQETSVGGETVYTCVANNTVATANATKAISVNEGSAIEQLENVTAVEGRNATLNCTVTGIPVPSVSWLEVKTGNHFSENLLVFANVSRKQAGEYICQATNPCGNDSKIGILSVNYPPEGVQLQVREGTVCKGANIIFNCSAADANPMELTYHLYENNVMVVNSSSTGIWNRTMTTGGVFVYSCKVTNIIGTEMSTDVSVTVNDAPEITHISAPHILIRPEMLTLNCPVDGKPQPNIIWTNGETVNMPLTVTGNKNATCYRCTASNEIGTVFKDTLVTHQPKKTVEVGLVFTMTFKTVYSDLENPEAKELIGKIEEAVKVELSGTELTQVRVASLKEGSVIADLKLTFNSSTYEDYLRERLQDATKDNKLGDLDVKQVVVGRFISTDEPEPVKCNQFFEGKDCKKASGALIALIVVAVIVVVAILIGIVACSLHKKNASGGGSFQNVKVSQRQDPEGNNSLARDYGEPGGSRETLHGNDNTGYDPERPPESTQMVTFNSNNGQMQGIHLPDSRSQKAQPGEGTYADLGDFQPKPTAPATLPPIKKPPTYEETNYAEITQFLKAPVAPKQDEGPQEELALLEAPVEEPDENAKDDAWNNLNNDSAALSRETKEETNADKLYPSLELVKSENKTEQIVVSI